MIIPSPLAHRSPRALYMTCRCVVCWTGPSTHLALATSFLPGSDLMSQPHTYQALEKCWVPGQIFKRGQSDWMPSECSHSVIVYSVLVGGSDIFFSISRFSPRVCSKDFSLCVRKCVFVFHMSHFGWGTISRSPTCSGS